MIDSLSCVGFWPLSLNLGQPALCPGLFLLPAGRPRFLGGSESMKLGSGCGGERRCGDIREQRQWKTNGAFDGPPAPVR